MKRLVDISICIVLVFGVLAFLLGCNKKAPETSSTESKTVDAAAKTAVAMADEAKEQTICPIMKNPINKEYYTEYEGRKVYFCCPSCKEAFAKDPEKYIKDLPQFN